MKRMYEPCHHCNATGTIWIYREFIKKYEFDLRYPDFYYDEEYDKWMRKYNPRFVFWYDYSAN